MVVSLRELTKQDFREFLKLEPSPDQQSFVATNAKSIAEAHFHDDAWFRGIYDDDTPVGFVMISDIPEKAEYFLWRLMIDQDHQRKGIGRRAIELLIDHVRTRPDAEHLWVSYKVGEHSPEGFYQRLGFVPTGEVDEHGEHLAKIAL